VQADGIGKNSVKL